MYDKFDVAEEMVNGMYHALDGNGVEYIRKPIRIGELPHRLRRQALDDARNVFGTYRIQYGRPLYQSLNMNKEQARRVRNLGLYWIMVKGEDFALWDIYDITETNGRVVDVRLKHFRCITN